MRETDCVPRPIPSCGLPQLKVSHLEAGRPGAWLCHACVQRAMRRQSWGDAVLEICRRQRLLGGDTGQSSSGMGIQRPWPSQYGKAFEHAIASANKGIELNPRGARGYVVRAIIHTRSGNDEQAAQDCNRALNIDPTEAVCKLLLGLPPRTKR